MLKKNWSKLAMGVLFALGAIFAIMALTTPELPIGSNRDFMNFTSRYLGFLAFFAGMTAVIVLKILSQKKLAGIVLLVTGIATTVLFGLHFIDFLSQLGDTPEALRPYGRNRWTEALMLLIALGLVPLVKGCKKVLCEDKK